RRAGNLRRRRGSAPRPGLRAGHADRRGRAAVRGMVLRLSEGMNLRMNSMVPTDGGVAVARALLLGVVVTMLISTSVSIGFEFLSYIAYAALPEPRRRLIAALRSPIVIALLPFAVVIFVGIFYGATSWSNALSALAGWRRMLLLPLAAAVFDDE